MFLSGPCLLLVQIIHDQDGVDITVFWRLNRGKEEVDHHCFFFYQGPKYHPHHSSYETHDFDTQVLGHDWLREKGYKNCWGVGRHVLGSQIFDYWYVYYAVAQYLGLLLEKRGSHR